MDQEKIGKFIAERRKMVDLTQMQLAEKLNITNRAVSKWETGKTMPDSAIMLELCDLLHISVNDLLHGAILSEDNYDKKIQEQLLDLLQQKERSEKRLIFLIVILKIFVGILAPLGLLFTLFAPVNVWHDWVSFVGGVIAIVSVLLIVRYERTVGYYQCKNCQHIYTPTYGSLFWADGFVKKKKLRCPHCKQRNWHKKVYNKE